MKGKSSEADESAKAFLTCFCGLWDMMGCLFHTKMTLPTHYHLRRSVRAYADRLAKAPKRTDTHGVFTFVLPLMRPLCFRRSGGDFF